MQDVSGIIDSPCGESIFATGVPKSLGELDTEKHKKSLLAWLNNKKIALSCDVLLISSSSQIPVKIIWSDVINEPEKYFNKMAFQLYDLDLAWLLEYQVQEIARFGYFDKGKG